MRRSGNLTDLLSGLLLIAVACLALVLSWPLRVGTAFRMGPGYVPLLLCYVQIALGIAIVVQSHLVEGKGWEPWVPRPILLILAAVTFFGLAIERFGLLVAVTGLVVLSCLASRETPLWQAVALGVGLAVFSVLVFVTGLRLPIPVLPTVGSL